MEANVWFEVYSIGFTDVVVFTWIIMALLCLGSIALTRNLKRIPRGSQHIVELAVDGAESLAARDLGQRLGRRVGPLITSLILFIFTGNLFGIVPGSVSPTADWSTTGALAVIVLLFAHGLEISEKGFGGYLRSYFRPFWWMLPFNILGEITKVMSHSLRLYGNMFGGGIILSIIYMFAPYVLPVLVMGWFGIFAGVVQTAVFALLAIAYIQIRLE